MLNCAGWSGHDRGADLPQIWCLLVLPVVTGIDFRDSAHVNIRADMQSDVLCSAAHWSESHKASNVWA